MKHDKIGSVMTMDVVRAVYGTPFKEVARLLVDHRVSGLPVVDDDDRVIGVVSETDLMAHRTAAVDRSGAGRSGAGRSESDRSGAGWFKSGRFTSNRFESGRFGFRRRRIRLAAPTSAARRRAAKATAGTAGQLMSAPPVTVHADDTIVEAARTMARRRVERLPVLDEEDRLVGIVTRRDVLRIFLRPDADIREEVIHEVLVRALWLAPRSIGVSVTEGVVTLAGRLERRSETETALRMTRQVDGVVAVVDQLTWRLDDARLSSDKHPVTPPVTPPGKHPVTRSDAQPGEQVPHGVAHDRLRRP